MIFNVVIYTLGSVFSSLNKRKFVLSATRKAGNYMVWYPLESVVQEGVIQGPIRKCLFTTGGSIRRCVSTH